MQSNKELKVLLSARIGRGLTHVERRLPVAPRQFIGPPTFAIQFGHCASSQDWGVTPDSLAERPQGRRNLYWFTTPAGLAMIAEARSRARQPAP